MADSPEKFRGRQLDTLKKSEWQELVLLSMVLEEAFSPQEIIRGINKILSGDTERPMNADEKPQKEVFGAIFFHHNKGKIRSVKGGKYQRIVE